jgi:hypothetical protein
MLKNIYLYVPVGYSFGNYFIPKIKNPNLECFEAGRTRMGIQRKGNNHLVVFLEFGFKKRPLPGEKVDLNEQPWPEEFHREFVVSFFKKEPEIALYKLVYDARMSIVAWEILTEIADDERILVDEGLGSCLNGPQLANELKELLEFKPEADKSEAVS